MKAMKSLILTLCVISLAFAERSPVLLWGSNSVAIPSLATISGEKFSEVISPLLTDKALVVFLEKDLTNKDFLCANVDDGKSCFAHLQGMSDKTFYAGVESPVEFLEALERGVESNSVDASGKLSKPLETTAGKINFVKFDDDISASRASKLQSHDSMIASIASQVGENVFFIYTSTPSTSLKRQRRDTSSPGFVFRDGANLLLYFQSLSVTESGKPKTNINVDSMTVTSNSTSMSVTLGPLTFDVTNAGGYFFMKNVRYPHGTDYVKFIDTDVNAPTDFSYFCGDLTLISIATDKVPAYTLEWSSLQFQAPFGKTKNESFIFGDAWHCVGFFTGSILSGLLIVALLLTITFIGVCWMMDINTMDRFDDPKGKTITINSSD